MEYFAYSVDPYNNTIKQNIIDTDMDSLLRSLITSKTRINILMRLFLNPAQHAYLRELADEFNASPSQVKDELTQLIAAGFLVHEKQGRKINYKANTVHPLYPELHSMVKKALGMDRIIDSIIERLGQIELAFLTGDYAAGKDTGLIDLLLVGTVDHANLRDLVGKTEKYIERKIRTLVVTKKEFEEMQNIFDKQPRLLLWSSVN